MITEIAWAAGFFDGEGSTSCPHQGRRGRSLQMAIGQVSRYNLQRFAATVQCGSIHAPRILFGRQPISRWVAYGHSAHCALKLLWPYLGEDKQDQALSALFCWATRRVNKTYGFCERGHDMNATGRYRDQCLICKTLRRTGRNVPPVVDISAIDMRVGVREYEETFSATAAVAWTFGLESRQYRPRIET
jgi:hypothetical protein